MADLHLAVVFLDPTTAATGIRGRHVVLTPSWRVELEGFERAALVEVVREDELQTEATANWALCSACLTM